MHLYLAGYRGTGKSTVAVELARFLGRPVIDLDQVIEANAGKSIREIFADGGEAKFRELESEALEVVSQGPPAVISLGGGAILRAENRNLIGTSGLCVWLDADVETIARRIDNDASSDQRRPALTSLEKLEEIRQLLDQRRPLYQQVADARIDTSTSSVAEVAQEIRQLWLSRVGLDRSGRQCPEGS